MINPINNIINALILHNTNWKIILLQDWKKIIGDLYNRVTLENVYDDLLVLGVYNSSWLQELYLLSPLLLKTINANLDQPRIKRLRFKLIIKRKSKKLDKSPMTTKKLLNKELTKKENAALQLIHDEELRFALEKFLFRCHQERV